MFIAVLCLLGLIGILGDLYFGFSLFNDSVQPGGQLATHADQANLGMSLILTAICCFGGEVLEWLQKFDAERRAAAKSAAHEPADVAYEPANPWIRED